MEDKMYYIGKVEKICNISKKTLRYYDKVGVLSPDKVLNENGYRYYSKNNLLSIPVIKYYKQSGFKLEEIKAMINSARGIELELNFREKVDELEEQERKLNLTTKSVKDWYSLVREANMVKANQLGDVSIKYVDKSTMLYLDQEFKYDYMDSIINIEFTNYIEKINNAITGPVILCFDSYQDKLEGKCRKVKIIQKNLVKCEQEKLYEYGQCMMISCYHIGLYSDINKTYEKILRWAEEHKFKCEEGCYERYVVDYWTQKDETSFVTEILIKIKR